MRKQIRVLVCEDSVFIRKILAKIIDADRDLRVVGIAGNGREGVEMARDLKPDVITMDIRMPVMDGFQATRIIMTENPTPILVVSSSVDDEDLKISFNAIQAGALDIMEKPRGHLSGNYLKVGREITRKLKLIAGIKVFRHLSPRHRPEPDAPRRRAGKNRSRAVAVGASTGGPSALFSVITSLGKYFPAPIFVTLHISEGFGRGCVEWIRRSAGLDVRIAGDGEKIRAGTVYFSPESRVMRVPNRGFISVDDRRAPKRAMPINAMMESFAGSYGPEGVGVLLTGMGSDGALGMKAIKENGGRTIAQDRETSVIFGMPKEAIAMGVVDYVLPLERIPSRMRSCVSGAAP